MIRARLISLDIQMVAYFTVVMPLFLPHQPKFPILAIAGILNPSVVQFSILLLILLMLTLPALGITFPTLEVQRKQKETNIPL